MAEIAELAAARDVPVVISTLFETGVGIAAALAMAAALPDVASARWPIRPTTASRRPGSSSMTCWPRRCWSRMAGFRPPRRAGSGGLGVVLDARALDRYRVESIGRLP